MKTNTAHHAAATLLVPLFLALSVTVHATIPANGLVGAYTMNNSSADSSGKGHNASTSGVTKTTNRFGTAQMAYYFNGSSSVLTIPDHNDFSVNTTGYLSISVWVRPDGTSLTAPLASDLLFSAKEGSGYVHWMGKGNLSGPEHGGVGNREWTLRIYSADNTEGRVNRMSVYHFPYWGGKGPGSNVQDDVVRGTWIHYIAIISKPDHRIWWYKNGVSRDDDGFGPGESYPIADADLLNGNAAVKMGSQDGSSYFCGAIDNVYFYNRKLLQDDIDKLKADTTP